MTNLIRSEWIKFRTVRSTLVLLFTGGLLTVVIALLVINDIKGQNREFNLTDISFGVQLSVFLFGALGVQVLGQEYRFSTIRNTFSASPVRWKVLVAKLIVVCSACAAMGLAMMLVCVGLGSMFLDGFTIDSVDQRVIWATALFAAGWAGMGLGLGAILRQPIAGIIILLGEAFIAEGIIANLFHGTAKWMPFLNGIQMTMRNEARNTAPPVFRDMFEGGVYFFVVVAIVLAIGFVLAEKRDA
ncbi:MAG: ABC transporter permease [Aquihabitans sp.]